MNYNPNETKIQEEAHRDTISQFIGMLSAAVPVFAILGVSLDWFNAELIANLEVFLIALFTFAINIYTIWKNHYSGKKAQEQNRALYEKGLK